MIMCGIMCGVMYGIMVGVIVGAGRRPSKRYQEGFVILKIS